MYLISRMSHNKRMRENHQASAQMASSFPGTRTSQCINHLNLRNLANRLVIERDQKFMHFPSAKFVTLYADNDDDGRGSRLNSNT